MKLCSRTMIQTACTGFIGAADNEAGCVSVCNKDIP